MQYRMLGRTGIEVSEIGFGAWGIGGGWGQTDDVGAERALLRAYEQGVTFFDTALVYGDGHSENLVGQITRPFRDKIVIASKIPPKSYKWPVTDDVPIEEAFPADWIVECTERSLKNLGVDYLDVQQLHAWSDAFTDRPEWLEGVERLKTAGKIRAFGVSANDWDPYGATNLVQSGLIDSVQVIYNIFEQRPSERLLPAALATNTGIIVRVPFEEGLLTGAFGPGYQFDPEDWRKDWLTPDRLAEAEERVGELRAYLDADTPTLPLLALKFCLAHPVVSTVIPGMRRVANVDANVQASAGKPLSEDVLARLAEHEWIHGWAYPWAAA